MGGRCDHLNCMLRMGSKSMGNAYGLLSGRGGGPSTKGSAGSKKGGDRDHASRVLVGVVFIRVVGAGMRARMYQFGRRAAV